MRRAVTDPDSYIAATQLGITMASLGLGWIGEPALAEFVTPAVTFLPTGIAEATAHSISVAIAFAIVTALHITLGELAPKTIALERSEATALLVVQADRDLHAQFLAVHPHAERHGTRRREHDRAAWVGRSCDGALGRGTEDARHRESGSRRARGAGRADAAPRLRLRRPDGGPDDGAAHRTGRRGRPTAPATPCCGRSPRRATPRSRCIATTWTTSSECCMPSTS